ncbi:hypothetical protein GOODEAATRI_033454, partial [Goodea atripinnis]
MFTQPAAPCGSIAVSYKEVYAERTDSAELPPVVKRKEEQLSHLLACRNVAN